MLLDPGKNPVANPRQQRHVRPRCLSHEMLQRLMLGRYPRRRRDSRQRLHALTLHRHQKSHAIILQRLNSVGMADHLDQSIDIGVECGFTLGWPVGQGGTLP